MVQNFFCDIYVLYVVRRVILGRVWTHLITQDWMSFPPTIPERVGLLWNSGLSLTKDCNLERKTDVCCETFWWPVHVNVITCTSADMSI